MVGIVTYAKISVGAQVCPKLFQINLREIHKRDNTHSVIATNILEINTLKLFLILNIFIDKHFRDAFCRSEVNVEFAKTSDLSFS